MQAPKTDTPATQETPWDERHKQLEAEYREWEAGERKAGKLWRDIGPYTEWIYRRMDTAESTLAAERASRVQAEDQISQLVTHVNSLPKGHYSPWIMWWAKDSAALSKPSVSPEQEKP